MFFVVRCDLEMYSLIFCVYEVSKYFIVPLHITTYPRYSISNFFFCHSVYKPWKYLQPSSDLHTNKWSP